MSRDRSSATGSAGRLPPKPINNIQASRRRIDAAQMPTRAVIKAKFHYTGRSGPVGPVLWNLAINNRRDNRRVSNRVLHGDVVSVLHREAGKRKKFSFLCASY